MLWHSPSGQHETESYAPAQAGIQTTSEASWIPDSSAALRAGSARE